MYPAGSGEHELTLFINTFTIQALGAQRQLCGQETPIPIGAMFRGLSILAEVCQGLRKGQGALQGAGSFPGCPGSVRQ